MLHGDDGSAVSALAPWRTAARARGVVLFAPLCPKDRGCTTGSFWRWHGDPSWLFKQVDALGEALGKETTIDRARTYLAGWSGGASWMGLVAPRLGERFAGLSFDGGGLSPSASCPPCLPPVHYLAGNRNPLHEHAVATRDWLSSCGARVLWEPLPGRDRAGELAALSRRETTARILDFLLATRGTCVAERGRGRCGDGGGRNVGRRGERARVRARGDERRHGCARCDDARGACAPAPGGAGRLRVRVGAPGVSAGGAGLGGVALMLAGVLLLGSRRTR